MNMQYGFLWLFDFRLIFVCPFNYNISLVVQEIVDSLIRVYRIARSSWFHRLATTQAEKVGV